MKNGGKRPGAGRKKGAKTKPTLAKEAAREQFRQWVTADMRPLYETQRSNALGIKYLVARERKTGKFVKLTSELAQRIISGEDTTHEMIEVWEKDPSVQAFTDLINRAIDKPKEQEQLVDVTGELRISWQQPST